MSNEKLALLQRLVDKVAAEQEAAIAADKVRTPQSLANRDRHTARAGAFIEAINLVKEA